MPYFGYLIYDIFIEALKVRVSYADFGYERFVLHVYGPPKKEEIMAAEETVNKKALNGELLIGGFFVIDFNEVSITAVWGMEAVKFTRALHKTLTEIAKLLKCNIKQIPEEVNKLIIENKYLKTQV